MTLTHALRVCAAALLMSAAVPSGAQMPTTDFWLNVSGDPAALHRASETVTPGGTVTISLYYTTDTPHYAFDSLVGFDRATSTGSGAVPEDGLITLDGGSLGTALTYANPAGWGAPLSETLGGGSDTAGADRPYGVDLELATLGVQPATAGPVKLYDLKLDISPTLNSPYTLTIWDKPGAGDHTTFVQQDGTDALISPASSYTLTLNPTPEPGGFCVLALGAVGLTALRLRRRRA